MAGLGSTALCPESEVDGKAVELPTDAVTRAVLTGFLKHACGDEVNSVNVRSMAGTLGILVEEVKSSEQTDFNEWLHVAVWSGEEKVSLGGTFFGAKNEPRIVPRPDARL